MKKIKYVLIGILALGILGAIFNPKKKQIDSKKVKTEKVEKLYKENEQPKKLIDLDNSKFWNEFDHIVKERVYVLIENKDCKGLQEEFDAASENLERHHLAGKTSNKHLDLMSFLDEHMKDLGCFK